MRIKDYPISTTPKSDDVFIVEGGGDTGTQQLSFETLKNSISGKIQDNIVEHRKYRGKNLGSTYTYEQKQAIEDGTFEDLYVGDYWTINGTKWVIADINHWTIVKSNHLCIIPETPIGSSQANSNAMTYTNFAESTLNKTLQSTVLNKIKEAFGDENLKEFTIFSFGGYDSTYGTPTALSYYNTKIALPTLCEMFNWQYLGRVEGASRIILLDSVTGIDGAMTQLQIFKENPNYVYHNSNTWNNNAIWLHSMLFLNPTTKAFNGMGVVDRSDFSGLASNSVTWEFSLRPIFALA